MTIIGDLAIAAALIWVGMCIRDAARTLSQPKDQKQVFDPTRRGE